MKKVILFSEIKSGKARRAAETFARQGDIVYALVKQGKEYEEQGICCLKVNTDSPEDIGRTVEQISEKYLDMLVLSASEHSLEDGDITERHDYQKLLQVLNENVVFAFIALNVALPLLRAGKGKRIAVLTEVKSSINLHRGEDDYGYQMSLASLNMMERLLFNALRPEGFTFRNYAASEMDKGMSARLYLEKNLCYDKDDAYIHSDENRLVMRNALLEEIPW